MSDIHISNATPKGKSQVTRDLKGSVKFINVDKNAFFSTLRKRVDNYFVENRLSKSANSRLITKTMVLLAMYLLPFIALLFYQPGWGLSLLMWTIMGVGMAGLGMSVMHDANHGAYSSNSVVNWIMAHILNIMGGSTYNWKLQHNILHHTYTNITHMDDDIASKPALRLSPHLPAAKVYRYQWFHAFFLYGLTTLYWVTAKDFVQYYRYRKNNVNTSSPSENRIFFAKLVLLKLAYLFVFLVVPTAFFDIPFIQVLTGFLLMHFLAGVILTVIFQLAHSVEGTSHPMPTAGGIIENDWAIHQMNTTINFSPKNKLLSWYVGGLNFQVEHHLFPKISHIHYPAIAPIVEQTAREFNVPYLQHGTFAAALRAHITFLKKLGKLPDLEEAIG
jgi:linoleoyl-CoA desaturase